MCRHFLTDNPTEDMIAPIVSAWEKSEGNLPTIHKALLKVVYDYADKEDDESKKALEAAVKLIDDTNQMDVISSNAKSMGKPNATKDIVVEISKLVDKFWI